MTVYARVAAVTGANKGIGLAIVRGLALQYPTSALNSGPLLIYLTARDASRGQAALRKLESEGQLRSLQAHGGPVSIAFKQLDVSNTESIDAFVADLRKEHGAIDVVINNAGIAMDGFDSRVASTTLQTNYYGTIYATTRLLPLLKPASSSRLVNFASMVGTLAKYPTALQDRFRAAASAGHACDSVAEAPAAATALMGEFEDGVRAGTHEQAGFPSAAYAVSKAGLIAATKAVAGWESADATRQGRPRRGVQACCPGWVVTDMTKGRGQKTVDEGAVTPVWLALADGEDGREAGGFWQNQRLIEW